MKVAFLLQDTGSVYGAERATLDLAEALAKRGKVEPRFLLIREKRLMLRESAIRDELTDRKLPFSLVDAERAFSFDLVRAIRREVNALDAQALHTIGYKADLHGALAMRWGRIAPLVATVHGWLFRPDAKERLYGWLDVQCLKRFQAVVTLSSYYEQMLAKKGLRNLLRIASGIDVAEAPCQDGGVHPDEHRPFTFGIFGRLSWEKNHELFLHAVKLVNAQCSAKFLIAGEGSERGRIERKAQELGIADKVMMTGYLKSSDFFRRIDALVMCSRIENLPYSILEAMCCRKPVVGTAVGGIPDLVDEGVTGFLVCPDDHLALADKMTELARSPSLALAMGTAGRERVEEVFSQEAMVRGYEDLYGKLMLD